MNAPAQVVLASGNPGKLREIRELLSSIRIELIAQSALGATEVEETGSTFYENALIKARNAATQTGLGAISDDSGLEVDVLGGAPGVRSARYAGPAAADDDNILKLLSEMEGVPDEARTARFVCVAAYVAAGDDPAPLIATGTWEGRILETPRGRQGFGYDPVFYVPELKLTAAELDPEEKNRRSHRGMALRELVRKLEFSQ